MDINTIVLIFQLCSTAFVCFVLVHMVINRQKSDIDLDMLTELSEELEKLVGNMRKNGMIPPDMNRRFEDMR